MFIPIQHTNRFLPSLKSSSYIHLKNVFRIDIVRTKVHIYSPFRPTSPAFTLVFDTENDASAFVKRYALGQNVLPPIQRIDQPPPDELAILAMMEYEKEMK